jgi:hypothetical protein
MVVPRLAPTNGPRAPGLPDADFNAPAAGSFTQISRACGEVEEPLRSAPPPTGKKSGRPARDRPLVKLTRGAL